MSLPITVGIPVFNEENYISDTLDSVLQSYEDVAEIIVSDNCSTDATADICRAYANKYEKIKFYAQNKNRGIFFNWKFVLEKASSIYFSWLGGHDLLGEGYYKLLYNDLLKKEKCVLSTSLYKIDKLHERVTINKFESLFISGVISDLVYLRLKTHLKDPQVMPIHGLIKTSIAKQAYPPLPMTGMDHYMLREILKQGCLSMSDEARYTRVHPRINNENKVNRYEHVLGEGFIHKKELWSRYLKYSMIAIEYNKLTLLQIINLKLLFYKLYYYKPIYQNLRRKLNMTKKIIRARFYAK